MNDHSHLFRIEACTSSSILYHLDLDIWCQYLQVDACSSFRIFHLRGLEICYHLCKRISLNTKHQIWNLESMFERKCKEWNSAEQEEKGWGSSDLNEWRGVTSDDEMWEKGEKKFFLIKKRVFTTNVLIPELPTCNEQELRHDSPKLLNNTRKVEFKTGSYIPCTYPLKIFLTKRPETRTGDFGASWVSIAEEHHWREPLKTWGKIRPYITVAGSIIQDGIYWKKYPWLPFRFWHALGFHQNFVSLYTNQSSGFISCTEPYTRTSSAYPSAPPFASASPWALVVHCSVAESDRVLHSDSTTWYAVSTSQ